MVKYRKAMMIILIAIIVLAVVLIASLLIYFGGSENQKTTWKEFEAMTPEEQMAFQNSFGSVEEFDKWLEEAQAKEKNSPWEKGGKKPKNYTWKEFEALTPEQQMAFQNSFKRTEDFEKWLEKVQEEPYVENPWENGGKKPEDYTWEEFEALTAEQQVLFQNSFKNQEKFDEWLQRVNQEEILIEEMPSVNWSKPLEEYTWEEFEAMTSDEQIIFQNSFESFEDFDKWMESVTGSEEVEISFEKNDFFSVTWEEFEAMTGEEQMIFQNSFGSIEEFDKWLKANEPK